jgi:hypothetical protein
MVVSFQLSGLSRYILLALEVSFRPTPEWLRMAESSHPPTEYGGRGFDAAAVWLGLFGRTDVGIRGIP